MLHIVPLKCNDIDTYMSFVICTSKYDVVATKQNNPDNMTLIVKSKPKQPCVTQSSIKKKKPMPF